MSPTSPNSCSSDKKEFNVMLDFDDFGEEITWQLENTCTGTVVRSGGPYSNSDLDFQLRTCLDDAKYRWAIFDTAGDGLCCGYGTGRYEVKYDGNIEGAGDEFGLSETVEFGVCNLRCPIGHVTINILITYDKFPKETSWRLTDDCTNEVVDTGSYEHQDRKIDTIKCFPSGKYTFTILDSKGDGINNGNGIGGYRVSVDGSDVGNGGDFSSSESISFGKCLNEVEDKSGVNESSLTRPTDATEFAEDIDNQENLAESWNDIYEG